MTVFLDYLRQLLEHEQAPMIVLGAAVPFAFQALKSYFNLELSTRVKFFVNVGLCALFSFVPLGIRWAMEGLPSADAFWNGLTTAAITSSAVYHTVVKPRLIKAGEEVKTPDVASDAESAEAV